MGFIFPISTQRSPLVATVYTFVAPVWFGALTATSMYLTLDHFLPEENWVGWVAGGFGVMMLCGQFKGIELSLQTGEEVHAKTVFAEGVLLFAGCAAVCASGAASYPWIRDSLPFLIRDLGYLQVAAAVRAGAGFLAVFVSFVVALFLGVLSGYYRSRGNVRAKRVSPIAAIREKFAKRRRRKEAEREDDILKRIHRDGGTSKISKSDLEFLKERGRTVRGRRA